jgi:hypothetical protein
MIEVTANAAEPLICAGCHTVIEVRQGSSYVGSTDGRVWHYGCNPPPRAMPELADSALRMRVLAALGGLRDAMPPEDVAAVQRFVDRWFPALAQKDTNSTDSGR